MARFHSNERVSLGKMPKSSKPSDWEGMAHDRAIINAKRGLKHHPIDLQEKPKPKQPDQLQRRRDKLATKIEVFTLRGPGLTRK